MTRHEKQVKERIVNDLKDHVITVKHEHGLYRHYRCQNRSGCSNLYFDVVTWPGWLAYTGDMGEYIFARTDDMIAFMRGSCMSYGYAAEKCEAHDGRLKEFCADAFEQELASQIAECEPEDLDDVKEKIEVIRNAYSDGNSHEALTAMYESDLWGGEIPQCEEYTYHFLWALHAIRWFCDNVELAVREKVPA